MSDNDSNLRSLLKSKLEQEEYDVVDLVPIPARGDRMVRLRTLEEALDEFDGSDGSETVGYLVQVRPKGSRKLATDSAGASQPRSDNEPFLDSMGVGSDGAPDFSTLAHETLNRARNGGAGALLDQVDREPNLGLPRPALPAFQEHVYLPNGKLNLPYLARNAELLYAAGDYALARNIFKTIHQSGERSASALFWMGRCFEAESKPVEAESHYEESITYQPTLLALRQLATLRIRSRRDLEAAETLERALSLKDTERRERFELHKACGNCWMRAEKHDLARTHFQKALELEPTADSVRANLGALYLMTGNTGEAKRAFQDALASNSKNDRALSGLGSCAIAEGDRRAAHDLFARSLEINLLNPTAIFQLVKCAYELKTYATAARLLGDYVEAAPVNANLLYSLAGLQFHLGRVETASRTVSRILELAPEHAGALELKEMIERLGGG